MKGIFIEPEFERDKINQFIRKRWNKNIPGNGSTIFLKAMGSGSSVVDDNKTILEAAKNQDDLYGIDMEAYGVALAAKIFHVPWLIIKGIQDYGDGEKNTTEQEARDYAAFASAAVIRKVVKRYFNK